MIYPYMETECIITSQQLTDECHSNNNSDYPRDGTTGGCVTGQLTIWNPIASTTILLFVSS